MSEPHRLRREAEDSVAIARQVSLLSDKAALLAMARELHAQADRLEQEGVHPVRVASVSGDFWTRPASSRWTDWISRLGAPRRMGLGPSAP
jgi:hypothetical protein